MAELCRVLKSYKVKLLQLLLQLNCDKSDEQRCYSFNLRFPERTPSDVWCHYFCTIILLLAPCGNRFMIETNVVCHQCRSLVWPLSAMGWKTFRHEGGDLRFALGTKTQKMPTLLLKCV